MDGKPRRAAFGLELVKAGRVQAAVDCVLPLAAARDAHERLARADVVGKLVLRP